MSLAQVQFGVAITMALLLSWAALVIVTALAFPQNSKRAEIALANNPKKTLIAGILGTALAILGLVLLGNTAGVIKIVGFVVSLCMGVILIIGGAGIAQLLGTRIGEISGAKSSFGALVRGSIVHSFSMLFPMLGWFLMLPLSILFAMGAGYFAIVPQDRTADKPIVPPLPHEGAF
jgi:hypothetical protein